MLDRATFMVGEAFRALRRNLAMTFASISTGAVTFFLLGMLVFAYSFASDYARIVPGMFDMRVFLRDGTSLDKIRKSANYIRTIPGVSKVTLIPKEKAWEKMKHDQPSITEGIDNPFPDQLRVILSDIRFSDRIATQIQSLPTVVPDDGVHYLRQEQRLANAALGAFGLIGPELFGLLVIASWILIYNTVRLTILSRRVEIRIMQLVGAPPSMIRIPFLIEGIIQGFFAGFVAALLLFGSYAFLKSQLMQQDIQFAAFPTIPTFLRLSLLGAGYGWACSFFAVRAPLTYR
ncbi:MAG TPA: permease-like cell division protein FtsX [Fimbriimonas sp.]|nr:permease-like cell division protein FtsX [Fimbriimonas sp.]